MTEKKVKILMGYKCREGFVRDDPIYATGRWVDNIFNGQKAKAVVVDDDGKVWEKDFKDITVVP